MFVFMTLSSWCYFLLTLQPADVNMAFSGLSHPMWLCWHLLTYWCNVLKCNVFMSHHLLHLSPFTLINSWTKHSLDKRTCDVSGGWQPSGIMGSAVLTDILKLFDWKMIFQWKDTLLYYVMNNSPLPRGTSNRDVMVSYGSTTIWRTSDPQRQHVFSKW